MHITLDHEEQHQGIMDLSTKATFGGSIFTALWGLFTVEQWIGIGGLLVAVIGLIIKTYFEWQESKRKVEMHNAKLAQLLAVLPKQEEPPKE